MIFGTFSTGNMPGESPLDRDSVNAVVVGGWVMGPATGNADRFVVNRLGSSEITFMLLANGDLFVAEQEVRWLADILPTACLLVS